MADFIRVQSGSMDFLSQPPVPVFDMVTGQEISAIKQPWQYQAVYYHADSNEAKVISDGHSVIELAIWVLGQFQQRIGGAETSRDTILIHEKNDRVAKNVVVSFSVAPYELVT